MGGKRSVNSWVATRRGFSLALCGTRSPPFFQLHPPAFNIPRRRLPSSASDITEYGCCCGLSCLCRQTWDHKRGDGAHVRLLRDLHVYADNHPMEYASGAKSPLGGHTMCEAAPLLCTSGYGVDPSPLVHWRLTRGCEIRPLFAIAQYCARGASLHVRRRQQDTARNGSLGEKNARFTQAAQC